ncbi:hypothetical protein [Jeotgalibaca porci]|uniref:hypothetical protein n=1 Tax=Jeotgalibaca porci TaxID=1868793 RepID=UPI00359FD6CE
MNKHLIVKYFDTYAESRKTFKTKEEAVNAVMEENKKIKHLPYTYWEYRGEIKVVEWTE